MQKAECFGSIEDDWTSKEDKEKRYFAMIVWDTWNLQMIGGNKKVMSPNGLDAKTFFEGRGVSPVMILSCCLAILILRLMQSLSKPALPAI